MTTMLVVIQVQQLQKGSFYLHRGFGGSHPVAHNLAQGTCDQFYLQEFKTELLVSSGDIVGLGLCVFLRLCGDVGLGVLECVQGLFLYPQQM